MTRALTIAATILALAACGGIEDTDYCQTDRGRNAAHPPEEK